MPTKKSGSSGAKSTPAKKSTKSKKTAPAKMVLTKRRHTITKAQPTPARAKLRKGQRVRIVSATPTKGN